jgi:hypothetical protein
MMNNFGMKAVLFVFLTVCSAHIASAGWLDNAVENAKERVGTRAVDEAADGSYDAAKDAIFNKDKGGAKGDSKSGSQPNSGSSFREPERQRPAAGLGGEAIDDEHFIQKDDFFVSTTALEKNAFIRVELAKMTTEPSARTKWEAEFFKVVDGTSMWGKHFNQSRVARDGDVRLGTVVIVFEGRGDENGVYTAPELKEEARGGPWFLAKVTDSSDLYRGYVTVSGNYKVSLSNLRVILPKSVPPAK